MPFSNGIVLSSFNYPSLPGNATPIYYQEGLDNSYPMAFAGSITDAFKYFIFKYLINPIRYLDTKHLRGYESIPI